MTDVQYNSNVNEMRPLRLVLGISGGIAAFKACELTRLLIKAGHQVQVVMTKAATEFVTPLSFQALSQMPVYTDLWDARVPNNMAHIDLSRGKDAIIIAPATANMIAKIANGIADDLLSTLCAARACPLILAPAMNKAMWDNPANLRNIAFLREQGVIILGPDCGEQACGEFGEGRMLEPEAMMTGVMAALHKKIFTDTHILLTAGPTFERIDPVRGISNLSSGKMGYALAEAAAMLGAQVTLVSGPTHLTPPLGCKILKVESAREMHQAVMQHIDKVDIFIAVAAVADFYIENSSSQKMKKENGAPSLRLISNPDILAEVAARKNPPFCVGFAAESEALIEHGRAKRQSKNIPLLFANLVPKAFDNDQNEVILIDPAGEHLLPLQSKKTLAIEMLHHIAARYQKTKEKYE